LKQRRLDSLEPVSKGKKIVPTHPLIEKLAELKKKNVIGSNGEKVKKRGVKWMILEKKKSGRAQGGKGGLADAGGGGVADSLKTWANPGGVWVSFHSC